MNPYKVTLWVYADSEAEVNALQETLNSFAVEKYNKHIYLRATTLQKLINQYGDSAIVNNFLR